MTLSFRDLLKLLALSLAIIGSDGVLKYFIHENVAVSMWSAPIYPYGGIGVFENILGIDLVITHVTNTGGPWGAMASHHGSLLILRVFAVLCLIGHLLFFNQIRFRQIPLVMIIAGAVGNILDSFFYGHVIDMLHFVFWGHSFAVFNIADASISLGITALLVHACVCKWLENRCKQHADYEEPAEDSMGNYGP